MFFMPVILLSCCDVPDTDNECAEQGNDVVDLVLGCPAVDEQADRDEGAAINQRREPVFGFGFSPVLCHQAFQDFIGAVTQSCEADEVAYAYAEKGETDLREGLATTP